MQIKTLVASLATLTLPGGVALAADYYVAPQGAAVTCTATGSQSCPYASVAAAFKSGKINAGDSILLMDGYHGELKFTNNSYSSPVIIRSQNGRSARIQDVYFGDGTSNLTLRSVQIWPTDPHAYKSSLVYMTPGSTKIVVDNVDARSGSDAGSFLNWSASEWAARAMDGVAANGTNAVIEHSSFIGMRFGIQLGGSSNQAIGNIIDGYSADGMRANGSYDKAISNRITNCVSIDDNHADGIQSFTTPDAPFTGIDLESNIIIEWTHAKNHPLRCSLQGIGFFDGYYNNLTMQNNVVSVRSYHGIGIYGAHGGLIANNTVVNVDGVVGQSPWIQVNPHKNGTPSTNVTIVNNAAMSYGTPDPNNGVNYINDTVITSVYGFFQDPDNFNYVPRSNSGLIDTANATYDPPTDILGNARPSGAAPDRGAYETGATGGTLKGPIAGVGQGIKDWGQFTNE